MDFKFSFTVDDGSENIKGGPATEDNSSITYPEDEAVEVEVTERSHKEQSEEEMQSYTKIRVQDGEVLQYKHKIDCLSLQNSTEHTDLVPGIYEGGAKTWECSFILVDYLSGLDPYDLVKGRCVLEVGCGSGLPGIYCLLKGAVKVIFQDYNKDVLEEATMENIMLSTSDNSILRTKCKFFAGDWSRLPALFSKKGIKCDIILGSEVIYNRQSYKKLHQVFESSLTDNGVIYLASKCHYFGVGGGIGQFKDFVESQGKFNIQTVSTTEDNLQCVIQKLTRKSFTES